MHFFAWHSIIDQEKDNVVNEELENEEKNEKKEE